MTVTALKPASWLEEEKQGSPGYLTIDLGALGRNYEKLAVMLAPARAAAVVKADAYGIGAVQAAGTLYAKGCREFFVAQFSEAIQLRPTLARDARIFVLNGLQPGNEMACVEEGLVPVVNSLEQWWLWRQTAQNLNLRLPAVLQFDTGMSRLGIPAQERAVLAAELGAASGIEILFAMSHLASADEPDNEQNSHQLAEMGRIAEQFRGLDISFANSAGILLGKDYHGVLARPGIALYGGEPTAKSGKSMEAVVSLDVAVIQTRQVPAGTKVGYGGSAITEQPTRLATVAAGYADGLPRSLSGRGAVYHDGIRLPIVGRVSMDSLTVDISALPEGTLRLGSLVEVLGRHQTLEDVARDAGTIAYEILTCLGHRYHRQYC